jgi:hypothetical protein
MTLRSASSEGRVQDALSGRPKVAAETVFSKYWEAVSAVRETRDDHKG